MVAVLAYVARIVKILLPTEIFLLSIYLSGSLGGKKCPSSPSMIGPIGPYIL